MTHLLLERLALQREDALKTWARDPRPSATGVETGSVEPRTRRTTTRRRARWRAW